MSRESGGRADKLGNRYEDYWSVELLLRLVDEKLEYLIIEPLGKDEEGTDILTIEKSGDKVFGMATVFLTNFIRCRTSFRMLFRLSLTMSLLGCDDLRQELTVKVRLPR